MTGLNNYKFLLSEVKAADMFDSDDDYQPSSPQYNLHSPKYFSMPLILQNSSYSSKFFKEDDYFPEPPPLNSLVEGVTDSADNEYFPMPPQVPEFNFTRLEDEEDNKYNPDPPVYPKINYSSEDDQDQAGLQ
ncbi:hypothetical protein R1flu_004548 [Riccia fluitans]|uniref:Uncharacterized protein n=1 Tax=Riccia fluitans TaxID=41844 RepID=A0ABD1YTJ2_9MARC